MFALFFLLVLSVSATAQPQMLWHTPFGGSTPLWSSDGTHIASGGDGGVAIVDVATQTRVSDVIDYAYQSLFSADGARLVTRSGHKGRIFSYSTATGELTNSVKYQDTTIKLLVQSRDKGRACVWYDNNVVVVIDVETLDSIMSVMIPWLQDIAISGDGTRIACTFSGPQDANVAIYNVGERLARASVGRTERMATLNETGDRVVTATESGLMTMWDVSTGNKIKQEYWSIDIVGKLSAIVFAPLDEHVIVVADQIGVYTSEDLSYQGRISQKPQQMQLSADGTLLLSNVNNEGIILYSLENYRVIKTIDRYVGQISGASLSPDGIKIAVALRDNTVRVYDHQAESESTLLTQIGPSYLTTRPRADRIITIMGRSIVTLELSTGREVGRFEMAQNYQYSNSTDTEVWLINEDTIEIRTIPDGLLVRRHVFPAVFQSVQMRFPDENHILGVFGDSTMRKVNIRTGETVWSVPRETFSNPWNYITSPTGRRFAYAGGEILKVYDANTGNLERTLEIPTVVAYSDVVFHPDDVRLIAGTYGTNIGVRIWDLTTGDSLHSFVGYELNTINPLLYPDGVRLATISTDSTISLWDIDRGEQLQKVKASSRLLQHGVLINVTGDLLVIGFARSTELWNALTLEHIVTLPYWAPRSIDATGSRIVATKGTTNTVFNRGVGSLGVIDISPYVLTTVDEVSSTIPTHQIAMSVASNPLITSSTVSVNYRSPLDQRVSISDLTGRVLLTLPGTGTLDPQHFTIERGLLPSAGPFYLTASDSSSTSTILLLAL